MDQTLLEVRVTKKTLEADDIASFELKNCDGSSLPHFSAGSHVDVNMANGLVRQYSLCNVPGETDRYLIAVLRDPNTRGGSAFMHDRVQQGDTLTISQPRNLFALARDARSEEHTSELQSLMRISYAVFCLKKKKTKKTNISNLYVIVYIYQNTHIL